MHWEYLRLEADMTSDGQIDATDRHINELGRAGWELISVVGVGGDTSFLFLWFKHPVQ